IYLHTLHVAGLRRQLQRAGAERAGAQAEVDRTAAALMAAHQAREALENLRGRQETAWRQAEAGREARAIDEIAVSRHRAREEENHGP
ncbi:MAG: flagellar FliJ family protein, partial [Deltaproteobacteria bacterium]|nr:flagellar FliJ family protein [Deltaproteobacteria bacterium]